jgi:hypothetical protein
MFYLRGALPDSVQWVPIYIHNKDLLARTRLHTDKSMDIGIIRVGDLILEKLQVPQAKYLGLGELNYDTLIGNNNIRAEIAVACASTAPACSAALLNMKDEV